MKSSLLKISGLAAIVLLLHCPVFAQDGQDHDSTTGKLGDDDEIIIKPKTDKDVKLNVEIKDGHVFVDGKPVEEFEDANVSVRKKKIMVMDGRIITINGDGANPDMLVAPPSPFRSEDGENLGGYAPSKAFLGVTSEKNPGDAAKGAKVKAVTKESAADKAGLREGDVITKVDETAITGPGDLVTAIRKHKPEDKINLTYIRDGKPQKTTATLGKGMYRYNFDFNYTMPKTQDFNFSMPTMPNLPDGGNPPGVFSWNDDKPKLGIKAQDSEDGKGVKVLDVDDDSPADKAGVKEDDIITRFDGKDVDSAPTLADLAREAKGKPSVKIDLIRDGKPMELEIKTPKKLKTADL